MGTKVAGNNARSSYARTRKQTAIRNNARRNVARKKMFCKRELVRLNVSFNLKRGFILHKVPTLFEPSDLCSV